MSKIYSNAAIGIYLQEQFLFLTFTRCTGTFDSLQNYLFFYDVIQKDTRNNYLKLQRENVLTSPFPCMARTL